MYTNAPVFGLIPTHCSMCNRPLVDGTSLEAGMGPICRRKSGYEDALAISADKSAMLVAMAQGLSDGELAGAVIKAIVADDSRRALNLLNRAIAVWVRNGEGKADTAMCQEIILEMGYTAVAEAIARRLVTVKVAEGPQGMITLHTPFNEGFVAALKAIKGRRWDKQAKVWMVPCAAKREAWGALKAHFAGSFGEGPKGVFKI